MAEQPGYVEDGAQVDNDGENKVGGERERPYFAVMKWKTVAYGVVVGAVVIGGGIAVAYFLYRRIRRLEDALSIDEITSTTDKLSKRVGSLGKALDGVRKTQVEMVGSLGKALDSVRKTQGALMEKVQGVIKNQEALAQEVQANAAKVSSVDEKLLKTQKYIVDVAKRQKWPYPLNNYFRGGLEEELGLPKR